MLSIRALLSRENKRRDGEPTDNTYEDVYIVKENEDGKKIEVKVDKVPRLFFPDHFQYQLTVITGILGLDRQTEQRFQICVVDDVQDARIGCKLILLDYYSSES